MRSIALASKTSRPPGALLVAALSLAGVLACKDDKPGEAVAEPSHAVATTRPSATSSSHVARTAPVVTSSAEASDDAASRARPESIPFSVLFSFPGNAEVDAIQNGVIACDDACRASASAHPRTLWFVDRARVVEDTNLQPWSEAVLAPRSFAFGGTYPEGLYASVTIAEDRVGLDVSLKFDGKLYQQAAAPPKTFDLLVEAPPPPEVLAELEEKRPASVGFRVAYGGDGPAIIADEAGVRARIDGKLRKLAIPAAQDGVRAMHRLASGYTLLAGPQRAAVLDLRGERVPLRVQGAGLEADLESERYTNVRLHHVGGEIWLSCVIDHGKPGEHTVLLAAAPRLLSPLHVREVDTATASLLNGVAPWKGTWSPSPPPPAPKPAP